MSAYKDDGFEPAFCPYLLNVPRNAMLMTLLECQFDEQTDYEVAKMRVDLRDLKRVYLFKAALFPFEITFGTLMFGKGYFVRRLALMKASLKFLFGQMSIDKFRAIADSSQV